MAKTVFDVLIEKITTSRETHEQALLTGSAKDFAQYREICGVIRGLNAALIEVHDLSRNYMEDNDG